MLLLLILVQTVSVLLPGFSAHVLSATELWPLTEDTQGREVLKKTGRINATLHCPIIFDTPEPILRYKAFGLNDGAYATIQLEGEMHREKFTLMGMFLVDLNKELVFFQYKPSSNFYFEVYVRNCYLHIKSGTNDREEYIGDEACVRQPKWYTVSVSWHDKKLNVIIVLATLNTHNPPQGTKVLETEQKELFEGYQDRLPENGRLIIGSIAPEIVGSAVCCVRLYDEEVNVDHVEKNMWSNCARQSRWGADAPVNPCDESSPCENSATCMRGDGIAYSCLCRPWNTGQYCEQELRKTNQRFTFVGHGDVSIPPMSNFVNVTVSSKIECASLCLQQNICISFVLRLNSNCTLFLDSTEKFMPNAYSKYYTFANNFSRH